MKIIVVVCLYLVDMTIEHEWVMIESEIDIEI